MNCAIHPEVQTELCCSRCGQPICPRCLVQTPVGARCPSCAALKRVPVYQIPALYYLRAVGIGLALAVGFGFLLDFIYRYRYLSYLSYLLVVLMGYAIGELISLGVNRKRGVGLQVIAGVSTALGFFLAQGLFGLFSFYGLIALALAVYFAVQRLR